MLNLTPHAISVLVNDEIVTFEPSGKVARVQMQESCVVQEINGIPVIRREVVGVDDLPKDQPCIVSTMVLDAIKDNKEQYPLVFAPDTGSTAVRNDKGHIQYVVQLVCN